MKELSYTFVDKTEWGDGPWQTEPDKLQYTDEATGLPCLAVRGPHGAWCGYVGVAEGHPFFGRFYDDARMPNNEWIDVHGGLTFSDRCQPGREHGICHLVEEGENDNVWWLGYDCAHAGDLSPKLRWPGDFGQATYRTLDYVKQQNAQLAQQLKEAHT